MRTEFKRLYAVQREKASELRSRLNNKTKKFMSKKRYWRQITVPKIGYNNLIFNKFEVELVNITHYGYFRQSRRNFVKR